MQAHLDGECMEHIISVRRVVDIGNSTGVLALRIHVGGHHFEIRVSKWECACTNQNPRPRTHAIFHSDGLPVHTFSEGGVAERALLSHLVETFGANGTIDRIAAASQAAASVLGGHSGVPAHTV